jgi:ribonuclease III
MDQEQTSVLRYPLIQIHELEKILGFKINNIDVYQAAFVHKSALKAYLVAGCITESYERLEFMGDSVINFIITRYIFQQYQDEDEGFLTRIRTKLVCGTVLADISKKLGLQNFIVMNERGLANGWNNNDRISEDVFEALVGALYLDLGLLAAIDFVESVFKLFVDFDDIQKDNNYKDMLMRHAQAQNIKLPIYKSLDTVHAGKKIFEVHCWVNGRPSGYGRHKNKKQAEQKAAYQALLFHKVLERQDYD